MSKPFKHLDSETIRYECSNSSFQRGKHYFDNQQVSDFRIEQEQSHSISFSARVKGAHAAPYKQLISIKWDHHFLQAAITGQCSCTTGYNCKHVAAVCMEYQQRSQQNDEPKAATACFDWLEGMDDEHGQLTDPHHEFLAYVLHPGTLNPHPGIEFVVIKHKKSGGLTKGRSTQLSHFKYCFSSGFKLPEYLSAQDIDILRLLITCSTNFNAQPEIKGWTGAIILEKLLAFGRLYWQNPNNPPLQVGETRELEYCWNTDPQGDYHLHINTTPVSQLILTDPPLYLDSDRHSLGRLNSSVLNMTQLHKLMTAPPVPAGIAEQFSQTLLFDYPHLNLPPPKPLAIHECKDLVIKPQLRLQGTQESNENGRHQLKLSFNYGAYSVPAYHPDSFYTLQTEQGYMRIQRNTELETSYIEQLLAYGFDYYEDPQRRHLLFYSPGKLAAESAARWQTFQQQGLPILKSQGWHIEIDQSFKLNFLNAEHWVAEINEDSGNWFEMGFMLEVAGESLPLLPLLMPVLEHYRMLDLPETLTIALDADRFISLPSINLKPFLAVLFEMFDRVTYDKHGAIRLSRFDAAGLAELEDSTSGLLQIKGGELLREIGQKIKNFAGIADVALPAGLNAELRHYQQQGLNWLQFLREYQFGGILADDMGLGKTLQTLTHLLLEKQSGRMTAPCLIIAPTSLMSNWRREAARFTPELRVLLLHGTGRKQQFENIRDYDLVLTTYPLLPRDAEFLLSEHYYYLILDEAQIVKNPNAKAAKIVRTLRTEHRLCLTGTPLENHLGELWTQFDFLMPGFLGDSNHFKRQFRTPIENYGSTEPRIRLAKRIAPFMLRRTKPEVAAELPPKSEIIRSIPLGPKQAMLYESIRLTMEAKVKQIIAEKGLARSHIFILDALLKLRQTCCDPRTLPLAEAQKVTESAKLKLLMEMLPELLDEGRRILVFSQFTSMLSLIEQELHKQAIAYSKLTGQTVNREQAIDHFKSGAADVFLISLKAGGVGLNLTEADTVIIYDPWWNPAVENQAADRAYRIGQEKPVFIYKLITENTVEEKLLAIQDKKRALADNLYAGSQHGEKFSFSAEDLSALLAPLSD